MRIGKAARWAVLPAVFAAALAGGVAASPAAQRAPVVEINAFDYGFDAPASLPAGPVELVMTNTGAEPHHGQIIRLNEGVTYQSLFGAFQENPDAALGLVTFWGGPGTVGPGRSSRVVVSLEEGDYAFLCFVSGPDGLPHLAKGMVKPFAVSDSGSRAPEPEAAGTITLRDFSFELPQLLAGPNTLMVMNEGPQPHEITILRLNEGATLPDVFAFFSGATMGPPPFMEAGGFQAINSGRIGWLKLDLTPGQYVALCNVPDPETGKSHAELGMVAGFEIP